MKRCGITWGYSWNQIPGVSSLDVGRLSQVRTQRSTTVSFMDAKTDLSLMYDSLEWDEAFMILGQKENTVNPQKSPEEIYGYGWSSLSPFAKVFLCWI